MAETVKFTPGPWRIAGKGTIRKGDSEWIADVHWPNRDANARLIAAAPDLLAALTMLRDADDAGRAEGVSGCMGPEQRAVVDAALAKAQPE